MSTWHLSALNRVSTSGLSPTASRRDRVGYVREWHRTSSGKERWFGRRHVAAMVNLLEFVVFGC
jgi:hypothetical protein